MLLIDSLVARDRGADTGAARAMLPEAGIFLVNGAVVPEYFIEVAAQTMAAVSGYDAICDGTAAGGGYLVGVDRMTWLGRGRPGEELRIVIAREMKVGPISLIGFEVDAAAGRIAEGVLRTWEGGGDV
jgi:predicted hotdog family 3-hydroxylacyl-ACP dehydratase